MKNAQVQLFTSIVKANTNQNKSIVNEQQEYMETQKELNVKLAQHIQQLNEFSAVILESIQEQKEEFDRRGRIEKNNRLYTKQVINHMAYTIEQYDMQLKTHNRLNVLEQQARIEQQEVVMNQMDSTVNKQRTMLRNLARKQSYYFEEIMSRLNESRKREKNLININSEEIQNQLKDMIETQNQKHSSEFNEVKKLLQQVLKENPSIRSLLATLPPNYPMKKIRVNGKVMKIDCFLFINESSGIAYFSLENTVVSVSMDKIEAIYWG